MKIRVEAAFAISFSLFAADFWTSKPFTQWSEKEAQRMVESSPWAKPVSVAIGSGEAQRGSSANRRSMGEAGSDSGAPGGAGGDPMEGGRGRNRNETPMVGIDSTTLVVRWQSALPVKQALVRIKYGSEAATSDDAKKSLESGSDLYVIAVAGVGPGMLHGNPESIKKALIEQTSLAAKGKDALKPADVQVGRTGRGLEIYFVFPKKVEFSVDDKEVEFATKFEAVSVRQKFRLKDMMFDGKLAL